MDCSVQKRIRAIFPTVILTLTAISTPALATPTQMDIDTARAGALAWLVDNQAGDGRWQIVPRLDIQSTSAALFAFDAVGIDHGFPRAAALNWLSNAHPRSVEALAAQTAASGRFISPDVVDPGELINARTQALIDVGGSLYASRIWGAYPHFQGSIPDTPVALDALLLGGFTFADESEVIALLANTPSGGGTRNVDGGWPYQVVETYDSGLQPSESRLIPTAYVLLSFSRWRIARGYSVGTQIDAAVSWILARAQPDGGFSDDPDASSGSVYETALVLQALRKARDAGSANALGATTPIDNAIQFLIDAQATDGSWNADPIATGIALQGIPGDMGTLADAPMADTDSDGVPDAAEVILGTDPNVIDTKYLPDTSSSAEIGIHDAESLGDLQISTSSAFSLPSHGGATLYQIVAGSLPLGLSLNPNTGAITGTASVAGTFNFIYSATGPGGIDLVRAAAISVTAATEIVQVPAMEPWTLAALGIALWWIAPRRRQIPPRRPAI